MSAARQQIEALHDEYVRLTGQQIFLNVERERVWFEWLRFRRPQFNVQDLRDVVAHLRRGIHAGKRFPAALKFTNLIGCPDYFEEDLAMARAQSRPRPPMEKTVVSREVHEGREVKTERRVASDGTENTARSAGEVLANIQKLKDAVK